MSEPQSDRYLLHLRHIKHSKRHQFQSPKLFIINEKVIPAANTFIQKQEDASNSLFDFSSNFGSQFDRPGGVTSNKINVFGSFEPSWGKNFNNFGPSRAKNAARSPPRATGTASSLCFNTLGGFPRLCFRDFAIDFALVFGQYTTKNLWIGNKNGEHSI